MPFPSAASGKGEGRVRGGRGAAGRLLTFLSRTALFPVEFSRPADALRGGKRSMTC